MTDTVEVRDVLSPKEVAERLGIHEETARRWLVDGLLPGRKVGGRWFVSARRLAVEFGGGEADGARDRIGLPEEVGQALGGGDLGGPAGPPDDDRPVRDRPPDEGGPGRGELHTRPT